MKLTQVHAVHFSPTGTTARAVGRVADALSIALSLTAPQTFDFTLPNARTAGMRFSARDLVVFGVPVYAGRVPNVLLPYLNTLDGCGATVVAVVVFGNRSYDAALIELRDILEQRGFLTVAAAAFVGEHAFSRVLGATRPDAADLSEADGFAHRVCRRLAAGDSVHPIPVRGPLPLSGYYQPRDRLGRPIDIRKVKPKVSADCTHCSVCVGVCPMGSIDPDDVSRYLGICIKCGACIKQCPEGARYYDDPSYLYHKSDLEQEYQRRAENEFFV